MKNPPIITITAQQAQQADEYAIHHLGIPEIVLMENAARHATEIASQMVSRRHQTATGHAKIAILTGGGNNGGDGYAMARQLHCLSFEVAIYALKHPDDLTTNSAKTNAQIVQKMGLPIHHITDHASLADAGGAWDHADLLIDAMLGTGFSHDQVRQPMADAIERCNQSKSQFGIPILAIDVPSGLHADTGLPSNQTVCADITVSFLALKQGMMNPQSKIYTGQVLVRDIGVSPSLLLNAIANLQA